MVKKITEQSEQILFVHWVKIQYPQYSELLTHFANGGYRLARSAALFKAMGVVAGYPDLGFFVPRGTYHGLFIEFKRPIVVGKSKPRIDENQARVIQKLINQGYAAVVAYGFEQAKKIFQNYIDLPDLV